MVLRPEIGAALKHYGPYSTYGRGMYQASQRSSSSPSPNGLRSWFSRPWLIPSNHFDPLQWQTKKYFEESPQRSSSSSGKHTAYSASLYPQDGLFPIQAAILEENAKQLKVINFQRQIEESAEPEHKLQRIQAQAKAA